MQRLEIEDPVEDQMGYVYEKSAIHHYLQQYRGSVKCPAGEICCYQFILHATLPFLCPKTVIS